jgi:hypothetical protein
MIRIFRGEVPTTSLDPARLPFKNTMVYDYGPEAASTEDFE